VQQSPDNLPPSPLQEGGGEGQAHAQKLTNALMKGGKKDVAEKIVRKACAL
jgi:ribosomal protein S7